MDEKMEEKRSDVPEKKCVLKKLALPLGIALVLGFGAGFLLWGISPSGDTPMGMVRQIEQTITRMAPGEDGAILASIEDDVITRKLFDLMLNMQLNLMALQGAQQLTQEEIVRMRNNPEFLRQFLRRLADNRVILKAMDADPDFQDNPDVLVFLNLTIANSLQEYYVFRKATEAVVSTNVTDAQIGEAYDQLRRSDPQIAANLDRMPMDEIRQRLTQQIIRQRQLAEVRDQLERARGMYRIIINDEIFGRSPDGAEDLSFPSLGQ